MRDGHRNMSISSFAHEQYRIDPPTNSVRISVLWVAMKKPIIRKFFTHSALLVVLRLAEPFASPFIVVDEKNGSALIFRANKESR